MRLRELLRRTSVLVFGRAPQRWSAPLQDLDVLLQLPRITAQLEMSYEEDQRRRFAELREGAQSFLSGLSAERQREPRLVLNVLNANLLLRDGKGQEAADAYRAAIREVERHRERIQRSAGSDKDARSLDFFSTALALLHNNLGEILSHEKGVPAVAEREFHRAIALQPGMTFVRQQLAEHYARHGQWAAAEQAYQDSHRCSPSEESEKGLVTRLTYVRSLQAQQLMKDGSPGEAFTVLNAALAELAGKDQTGWEGRMHFLRGECCTQLDRPDDAMASYQAAAQCYRTVKSFPSASWAAEQRADLLATHGRDDEAREAYGAALEHARRITSDTETGEGLSETRLRKFRLLSKSAVLALAAGRRKQASRALHLALEATKPDEWWNPYDRLVSQIPPLLARDDLVTAVKLYLSDLLAEATEVAARRDLIEALRQLYQEGERLVTEDYSAAREGETTPMLNVVTPLAVEIAADTLDQCGGPDPTINILAPAMRDRILQRFGFPVPGIRLRGNEEDLPSGTYIIMIDEIPRAQGTVYPDQRVFVGPAETLQALGIATDGLIAPSFHGQCYWVDLADARRLTAAGHTVWQPMEYVVRHLEAQITANLVEFLGHQEVQHLLETSGLISSERHRDIIARESARHMDPLCQVVRALVAERVPITNFTGIHSLFLKHHEAGLQPWQIIEEIRSNEDIKLTLWGNDGTHRLYQIGPEILRQVDHARAGRDVRVLAMEPEVAQGILAAIRQAMAGVQRAALVVAGAGRVGLLRSLTELEFPDLPVLSFRELRPGLGAGIVETIDLT